MLKIKDNIDIKELEKFGFEVNCKYPIYCAQITTTQSIGWQTYTSLDIGVFNNTREIILNDTDKIDILFDLIQAGLVEKVEGENK